MEGIKEEAGEIRRGQRGEEKKKHALVDLGRRSDKSGRNKRERGGEGKGIGKKKKRGGERQRITKERRRGKEESEEKHGRKNRRTCNLTDEER